MTRAEAIDKARKLLALAEGGANEHEAALAAGRAAELLARWNLSAEALDDAGEAEDEHEPCGAHEVDERGSATWRGVLLTALAKLHGCLAYRDAGKLKLVGRPARVAEVAYLYRWLVAEVERLARARRGRGRAWLNAYRHGAVVAILAAVREAHRAAEAGARAEAGADASRALVVARAVEVVAQRRAEADQWAAERLRLARGRRARVSDAGGYAAGKADGAGIYRGRAGASLGAGAALLRRGGDR